MSAQPELKGAVAVGARRRIGGPPSLTVMMED